MNPEILREVVKTGRVYDLGMEYFVGMPHHPNHPPFAFSLTKLHGEMVYEGGLSASNCLFATGGHTGTHFDALGHISLNGEVHGVGDIGPWQEYEGLKKGGIHEAAPAVCRGVLLDIAGLEGQDILGNEYEIGQEALQRAAEKQAVTIEQGDAVLIRTGWIRYYHDPVKYVSHHDGCPGLTEEGARWLVSRGVRYVGADTLALEKTPSSLPVHGILLVQNGIHILEVMYLNDLAADGVFEFLFVASPLKIRGGTASPVRPLAIA